jgi:hypothetical protein
VGDFVRRGHSLSTQFIDRLNRFSLFNWTRSSLIVFITLFVFSSACTNIGGSLGTASTEITQSDPNFGVDVGAFKLVTVLPSQASAGTLYDMVGENAEFDTFCSGTYGVCKCEYTYTLSGGGAETQQGNVTYQESNLLRCENAVPSGIGSFTVRIIIDTAASSTTTGATASVGTASNSISVNLSSGSFAGSDSFLDLTNAQSYVPVNRFQCRRRSMGSDPIIKNPLDSGIVDPIQSEDPKIIYPFNFYTTNPSEGLLQMQRLSSQEWECTLTATQNRSLHWWANPYVYSASPCVTSFCAGDSELMYPTASLESGLIKVTPSSPATGKRRASFSVASRSYGVFQIPIRAAVSPKDFVSAGYSFIGYGAKPIPNAGGSSSCPNIPLPPKATWVKLWNYRATDITPPSYVTGSTAMSMSAVVCNPKQGSGVFPSCDVKTVDSGPTIFGLGLDSAGGGPGLNPTPGVMASRAVALVAAVGNTNACYNVDQTNPANWTNPAAYPNGVEYWKPSMYGFENTLTAGTAQGLPWGLYSSVVDPVCKGATDSVYRFTTNSCSGGGAVGDPVTPPTSGVPSDSQVTTALLADIPSDPKNFSDQLFIVTDPSVDDSLMRNQALSVSQYKPVTYRSTLDCSNSSRVNCPATKEIHWDINVKEVGSTSSADIYPLCVLQFYD